MQYTVIKDFIERVSLKQIKAGEKYACLDPARAKKLIKLGYIKADDDKPEDDDVKPEKKTAKASTSTKRSVKGKKA